MNSRRTRLQAALAAITTALVLVPTGVLFTRVWQENSDQRDRTELERQGVEYLAALTPLISSLAEAQSTALQGVSEPPGSLGIAVTQVAATDARLGRSLQTTQRWTGLQDRIGKLTKLTGNPVTIFQSYVQATDLALALYVAVRRNSELYHDPDDDVSNLQQAVAVDMPTTVVRVGRMGDLATVVQAVAGPTRTRLAAQFGQEVLAVQEAVNQLTETLQAAVDDTESTTLSGSLVTTLDGFRRGVESMTRGANPGGTPNAATMSTAQSALKTALAGLAAVSLKEMERLLTDRLDTLDYRRLEALAAIAVVVLLVLLAVLLPVLAARRSAWMVATKPAAPLTDDSTGEVARRSGPSGSGHNPHDQPPVHGEVGPSSREWSGALR